MMTLKRSGALLDPKPSSLVIIPMNLKSTVGQYRVGVAGQERVRKEKQPMAAQTLYEMHKGEEDGQLTVQLYY